MQACRKQLVPVEFSAAIDATAPQGAPTKAYAASQCLTTAFTTANYNRIAENMTVQNTSALLCRDSAKHLSSRSGFANKCSTGF